MDVREIWNGSKAAQLIGKPKMVELVYDLAWDAYAATLRSSRDTVSSSSRAATSELVRPEIPLIEAIAIGGDISNNLYDRVDKVEIYLIWPRAEAVVAGYG